MLFTSDVGDLAGFAPDLLDAPEREFTLPLHFAPSSSNVLFPIAYFFQSL